MHEDCLNEDVLSRTFNRLVLSETGDNRKTKKKGRRKDTKQPWKNFFGAKIIAPEGEPIRALVSDLRLNNTMSLGDSVGVEKGEIRLERSIFDFDVTSPGLEANSQDLIPKTVLSAKRSWLESLHCLKCGTQLD